jgi:hypothetical protein
MDTQLPVSIILVWDGNKPYIMNIIVIGVTSMDNRDARYVPLTGGELKVSFLLHYN